MIFDEVENLIGYAEEPDDYLRTVGDYLIKSLYNEPQVPYFDEFGAEFYELSCQEIEQELKILFEVSKYFVIKAVRNEETIKMLKTLVSDLAKVGYDNYDFISNVIDTIADNYAAQNHVFMMIENLDEEIQMEIETIAKYCRKGDYKVVEVVEGPKEDSLLDILMENGEDLLELIGIKVDDDSEVEEAPELVFFEGFAEPDGNLEDNLAEAAIEEQEHPQFHLFGEFEEPKDPNLNQTDEISGPIVINLVMEPENPQNEDNLPESHAKNTETEEILDFLVENPKVVDFLLHKLELEESAEKSNSAKDIKIEELVEDAPEAENLILSNFKDEKIMMKNIDAEGLSRQDAVKTEDMENENIETKVLNLKNSNQEKINPENINVKGMIIKIPYPDEDINKNARESEEDEMNSQKFENPGIVPEAGNFKIIFPIKNENKIDQIEETENEDLVRELMKMNSKKEEDLKFTDQEFEEDSKFDESEMDLIKELEEELDEDIKFIKESNKKSNPKINKIQDKVVEKIFKAIEKDINDSENSNDKNPVNLQSEELEDTKESVDFKAENLNKKAENKNSNFEKFLKIPENFWQIPLGFWQNFQNFWGNSTSSSESAKNLGTLDEDSNENNQNLKDFSEKLNYKYRNSKVSTKNAPQDSDNTAQNSEDLDETELNLDTNKKEHVKGVNKEDPENDEKLKLNLDNSNELSDFNQEDKKIFNDEGTAEELDDEILISELLNGEIMTGDNEIFQPEIDESEVEDQDRQIIKDMFGFEEGIGGIDDEIVSKIKKNEKESIKDAKINDNENSKNSKKFSDNQNFKIEVKNPKISETDLDSEHEAINDEIQEIDRKVQESELKEDDFIPQFSKDDSDVEKVKIIDDENSFEELGKQILKLFGITENDNKEIEEFEENFNNEEDLNKSEGSIKVQNLTNKEEIDNLEQERQLMLELEDEKNSTKIDKILDVDEKSSDLDEIENNEEKTKNEINDEEFEGEIFDDMIGNENEISQIIKKIPKIDSHKTKDNKWKNIRKISPNSENTEALENPRKVDNKKYKNDPKQEVKSPNKISKMT